MHKPKPNPRPKPSHKPKPMTKPKPRSKPKPNTPFQNIAKNVVELLRAFEN